MNARALIVLAVLASSCSEWPAITAMKPLSNDPRLGLIVREASPERPVFIDAAGTTGQLYLGIFIGPGVELDLTVANAPELHFYAVDTGAGTATELPASSLTPTSHFTLENVIGDRGLLYVSTDTAEAAFFDGTAWVRLPALPLGVTSVIARSATEVALRQGGVVSVLVNGAWQQVSANESAAFGPWSPQGLRLITSETGNTCVSFLDLSTGTRSAPQCQRTRMGKLSIDGINGTVDDFQVLEPQGVINSIAWHYVGGTWETGALVTLTHTRATPRFAQMIGSPPFERETTGGLVPEGGLVAMRAAQFDHVLLPRFSAALTCSCDRETDRSCDCIRRPLAMGLTVAGDASQAWAFGVHTADAKRRFFVRHLAMPDDQGFDPLTCEPACATGKTCVANSLTQLQCVDDAAHVSQTNVSNLPSVSFEVVTAVDPAPVSLEVTLLDGGLDPQVTLNSPLPNVVITAPALTPYRFTLSAPGYVGRSFEVTTPDTFMSANLGKIFLPRGALLGDVDQPLNVASSSVGAPPRSDWMVLPVGARWTVVRVTDGGVSQAPLATVPPTVHRPRVDRDGRFLVLATATGLQLFDALTFQPRGAELPGTTWNTDAALFSRGSDTFAIDDGTTTSVIGFSSAGLQLAFTAPGSPVELSGDGTTVLVFASGQHRAHTAQGARPPLSLTRPLLGRDGLDVFDQVGSVVPFTLVDHSFDGGTATLTTRATFVTVDPRDGGIAFSENVGGLGVVRTPALTLVDGGIGTIAVGLSRHGILFTQPVNQPMVFTPLLGTTESLMGSYSFAERETGEPIALPACTGACEYVVLTAPARRIKAGQGVLFGNADRALNAGRIDTVDPSTGAVTMGERLTPMTGPAPTFDRRFVDPNQGEVHLDALGVPCVPFDWPTWRYQVSSTGMVIVSDGGTQRACAW